MTARPGALSVYSLADRPQLIRAVAEMRWREWGDEPGREKLSWWVEVTAGEAGRDGLPTTWVAVDEAGEATGSLGTGFYRRCGWEGAERLPHAWGEPLTILTKRLDPLPA